MVMFCMVFSYLLPFALPLIKQGPRKFLNVFPKTGVVGWAPSIAEFM